MKLLLHRGVVGGEVRPLYFEKAFGMEVRDNRIISFGACNFACPYCKRDGAFRADDGSIISAVDVPMKDVLAVCDDAIAKGQVVRLSGGDPVVFPRESMEIARYVFETYGQKISIAHNGSSPAFCRQLLPMLQSAAIDLKGLPEDMNCKAGLSNGTGERMYARSLEVQKLLSRGGVRVDVRTPVFGTTTLDDMLRMATDIVANGHKEFTFWTWRLYKPVQGCDWTPPNKEAVVWMIGEVKRAYPELKIGLRAKWEPSGFLYF